MPGVFRPRANAIACGIAFGLMLTVVSALAAAAVIGRSSYWTGVGRVIEQPVPFSHKHHVAGLGIDCRYCHTSVETSSYAGMPATETCMNCHSQLYTSAALLEPVRRSWAANSPVRWQRVHNVPDFVYFNHSVHVSAGVGCVNCHGRVDEMALTYKAEPLYMKDCLDCHRDPHAAMGPADKVFDLSWKPGTGSRHSASAGTGDVLTGLTSCSACHR